MYEFDKESLMMPDGIERKHEKVISRNGKNSLGGKKSSRRIEEQNLLGKAVCESDVGEMTSSFVSAGACSPASGPHRPQTTNERMKTSKRPWWTLTIVISMNNTSNYRNCMHKLAYWSSAA